MVQQLLLDINSKVVCGIILIDVVLNAHIEILIQGPSFLQI